MMEPTFSKAFVASHFGISTPGWVWGFNLETLGEIMRFVLACSWIALIAVGAVHLLRYATKVYEERIRWWK